MQGIFGEGERTVTGLVGVLCGTTYGGSEGLGLRAGAPSCPGEQPVHPH